MSPVRLLLAGAAAAALATTAQATVLVFDDFESYGPVTIADFAGFTDLTVEDGTVDFIREAGFGVFTPYGSGLVDLDGSTDDGGRLVTAWFDFNAGDMITLEFDVSGNQRRDDVESFTYGFSFAAPTDMLDVCFDPVIFSPCPSDHLDQNGRFGTVSSQFDDPWEHRSVSFTAGEAGSLRALVSTTSADGIGPLIDNFSLTKIAAPIPEPTSWAVMILGFGLAGAAMRRHVRFA